MGERSNLLYHIIAIIIVSIWGVTFISTKVLINSGLSPQDIFFLRFIIAYVGMCFISHKRLFAKSLKDELLLMAGGLTGGSIYFLTENSAIAHTLVTNVSFIVCTTPLITTLLFIVVDKDTHVKSNIITGSIISLLGMAAVVYNGSVILKISPLGDFLALCAAASWAIYSLIMKNMFHKYETNFITRKIFFYGLLTILPIFIIEPFDMKLSILLEPKVMGNLLFLGIIASLACYAIWNTVLKHIGTMKATNYIYLNPLSTLIGSFIFLDEPFTLMAMAGVILIISGMYIAAGRSKIIS